MDTDINKVKCGKVGICSVVTCLTPDQKHEHKVWTIYVDDDEKITVHFTPGHFETPNKSYDILLVKDGEIVSNAMIYAQICWFFLHNQKKTKTSKKEKDNQSVDESYEPAFSKTPKKRKTSGHRPLYFKGAEPA